MRLQRQKKEFECKLEEEFPFMCQKEVTDEQREKGGYSPYDAYSCEVGEGWYSLLRNLCLEVTEAYEEAGQPVDVVVAQVKEKFGTLRFYWHPEGQESGIAAFDCLGSGVSLRANPGKTELHTKIGNIIRKWEEKSATVCEVCGADGEIRRDLGWIATLCDACYTDRLSKRKEQPSPEELKAKREAELAERHRQTLTLASASGLIGEDTITIPDWAQYTDDEVFDACKRLREISVAPGNPVYKSIDGVLYAERQVGGEKMCRLVRYPSEREGGAYRIPEGVHSIDGGAFKGCAKLKGVHIPKTAERILWGIFCGSGVERISVDPENRDFTDIDGVLFSKYKTELHAYPPERDSDSYTIPQDVRFIWHNAFQNAHQLEMINIPNSVNFIGNDCFEGCVSLTEITLPQARFNDNCRVFYNCPSLENIYVAKNEGELFRSGHFQSIEGVLFNGPMTHSRSSKDGGRREWVEFTLVRYPEAKTQTSYAVPEGVSEILTYAFSGQSHLLCVTIPESVFYIAECAFEGCSEDLTLRCAENSCAHEYAKSENMKFEIVR